MENEIEANIKHAKGEANRMRSEITGDVFPVRLNDIVQHYSIPVKEADLEIDGCARMDSEGTCFILYKNSVSRARQRFTVAHELGHIRLEHISFNGDTSQHSSKAQEQEANAFAAELLVPSADLRQFLKNRDRTLEDVTERYWVSRNVAIRAIDQNRLLPKLKTND